MADGAYTNKAPFSGSAVVHHDDLAEAIVDRVPERGRLLRLDGFSIKTKRLPATELALDDQSVA